MFETMDLSLAEKKFDAYFNKIMAAVDSSFVYTKSIDLLLGESLLQQYTFAQKKFKTYEENILIIKVSLLKRPKGYYAVEISFPLKDGM